METKTIKHNDEYLTLGHYKEPLRKVSKGFGFVGCLLATLDGTKVQCHICGELFENLAPHLRSAHSITARDYRERFELAYTTALISEKKREKMKNDTLMWHARMIEKYGKEEWASKLRSQGREGMKKRKGSQPVLTLESKNKRGVCPDQLLQKIREVKEVLGHTPSKSEFISQTGTQRYVHLIYKTFGSWSVALSKVGLERYHKNKSHKNHGNQYRPHYDEEVLLEYLRIFYEKNNKIPTESDCKRGLIPPSTTYAFHFGSLPKARERAGIYAKPSKWDKRPFLTKLEKVIN